MSTTGVVTLLFNPLFLLRVEIFELNTGGHFFLAQFKVFEHAICFLPGRASFEKAVTGRPPGKFDVFDAIRNEPNPFNFVVRN